MGTFGLLHRFILETCTKIRVAVVFLVLFTPIESFAQETTPSLGLPVQCELGADCWLVNLVDHDPGKGFQDYRCTKHGYDGHKGTDIAIRDLAAMNDGVAVVASAAGTVKAFRDGMADGIPSKEFRRKGRKLFCGNGLVLTHGDGWETQYCHLRRHSIVVKRGQTVKAGQRLGYVGHSGMAEFPHVHLSVRHRGRVVDPFIGGDKPPGCGKAGRPLWTPTALNALAQPLTAIYSAGFAPTPPKLQAIRKGLYRGVALSRRAPALLLWAEIYWVQAGDKVHLAITGPDGQVVAKHSNTLPKRQAQRMIFAGRKKPGLFWPAGTYKGRVILERKTSSGAVRRFEARRTIRLKD